MEFAFYFLFLVLYISFAFLSFFKTAQVAKSKWGKSIWRNMKPKQIKWLSAIFLLAGMLFMIFAVGQLATGTFKWRGRPKTYSFSDFRVRVKAAKPQQEYQSPDGKYIAIIIPLPNAPSGSGESKVEVHSKDAIMSSASYSSEDGEHGFGVEHATWSPDSKFFVYSMSSSGGHQSWHFPTYFVSVNDFKTRCLDDYVGSITQTELSFNPPDIVHVYGHAPNDFEKETEISASLSKLLKE